MNEREISERIATSFFAKDKMWFVFLDRNYAKSEDRPKSTGGIEGCLASAYVRAKTRVEAAKKVWEKYRKEWLPLCTAPGSSRFSKRISLHVGEKGSISGGAGRLEPIRVE